MLIARYKFNSSIDTLFSEVNEEFIYTYTDIDNGDGTITRTIYSNQLPTIIRFEDCEGLLEVNYLNTSELTTLRKAFKNCYNVTSINATDWDTSNVTSLYEAFEDCNSLTSLDVSNFDTSNVTDMNAMFRSCSQLTQLDLSNWDTSEVTDMEYMFHDCSKLTQLDVSNWDTKNVQYMIGMFYNCSQLTQLDLSNWDTSKVTNMDSMFFNCFQLTQLDVSNWDTGKVTIMSSMFNSCSQLAQLDVSNFDTSNVTDMNAMFYNCSQLTQLDLSNWDTGKVTIMSSMFYGCSKLTQLDVSNWDTSSVTDKANITATIFKSQSILLNWSIEEINKHVSINTSYESTVYVNCDISKLTENSLITYVSWLGDETIISLPQPLKRVGDICDILYWDEKKGHYCIEVNINEDLTIKETPEIIDLPNLNKMYMMKTYEDITKIGYTNMSLSPIETTISTEGKEYIIENLQPSVEYTLQFNCLTKGEDIKIKIEDMIISPNVELGINHIKITTPSNITNRTTIIIYGKGYVIKDVILVEGEINQILGYFEGTQSLGEEVEGGYKITITSDNYSDKWKE